ncbi:MAG TPA: exodeoxyribonuclease III [Acidimicrobiales bacterium]|nr:exodeoxyribonuclease III [Acidimicrobiales bacterium]HLH46708.1 exodeoxyribonuclease III [Acidimicrobiales bacterium]
MRLATWNVNSLNARLPRVLEWLEANGPDVLCMQETKLADAAFPATAFAELGYESVHHGDGRWNGVAIASRVGAEAPAFGFESEEDAHGCRILAATCGGARVHSVYVPNGRSLDSEHYLFKLAWLARLRRYLEERCDPAAPVAVCGDFNVAPCDVDVWDPAAFAGATHVSEPERAALRALLDWGLEDVFRRFHPEGGVFSWWDYRAGDFHQGRGMRIDLVLLSAPLAARATDARIDRDARKGKKPSDHAPVVVELSEEGPNRSGPVEQPRA